MNAISIAARFAGLLLWAVLSGVVHADDKPAPHIAAEIAQARLGGQGAFRWFGLKLYDAQLWVGPLGYQPGAVKFALDLRYARTLKGGRIAQASRDEIEKLGFGSPEQRAAWLAQMESLFPDVQDGTHITGIHLPGEGARFYLDGRLLSDIKDAEFGKAFFAIWLDARTTAPALRAALLENAASGR